MCSTRMEMEMIVSKHSTNSRFTRYVPASSSGASPQSQSRWKHEKLGTSTRGITERRKRRGVSISTGQGCLQSGPFPEMDVVTPWEAAIWPPKLGTLHSLFRATSFPGSLFSASLGRWKKDPGCGWSCDHPEKCPGILFIGGTHWIAFPFTP